MSGAYHSFPWTRKWKKRMKRVDHSMIYVVVAATYTPLVGIVLEGVPRLLVLALVWGIAGYGIYQKTLEPQVSHRQSTALQVALGWMGLLLVPALAARLPAEALLLFAAGGVLYTGGMLVFVLRRPRLWPRVFSYHEVFHLMVVVAGASHFGAIYAYVAPLP